MRFRRSLVPLVLAMTILGGCAQTVQVRVYNDASGNPVFHRKPHATPVVKPGDRVVWICECPPSTEFTVSDLRFVADLDDVDEFVLRYGTGNPKEIESEILGLESLQSRLAAGEQPAESAEAMSEQRPSIQETIALLKNLESALFPKEQRNLFTRTSENLLEPGFVDGRVRIRSPGRVARGIGHGLWKFTWTVRKKGDPNAVPDVWDPHIEGHEEKPNN